MICIEAGHTYELNNFEGTSSQTLQFIHKEMLPSDLNDPKQQASPTLQTVKDGTTNEEVLAVLIDRMYFLQNKMASRENALVITKLEECLMWLNKRTADRKARNVEGTHLK